MINEQRLVNTFLDLVRIDSESGNESLVRDYITRELKSLNITPSVDSYGNLVVEVPCKGASKTVLLSAHMDTVKPGNHITPVITGNIISSSGDTILGGDDKSGVAEILEVIRLIKEKKISAPNLLLVFTVEEEIGVKGARQTKGLKADYGFVLDTDGPIGTVVVAAPYHETFLAEVKGKAAHAGIEPEKGVNAIVAASKAIAALPLGRIDEETVANVGIIEGGKATNIVPDKVMVRGEARSRNERKVNEQISVMKSVFVSECQKVGAKVKFTAIRDYDGYDIEHDRTLLTICSQAARACHFQLRVEKSCGGSDANFFNAFGIPTAVISSGMEKVHTCLERIKISDMVKATEFTLALLNKIKEM